MRRYTKLPFRTFADELLKRRPTTLHFFQITKNFGLLWETRAKDNK